MHRAIRASAARGAGERGGRTQCSPNATSGCGLPRWRALYRSALVTNSFLPTARRPATPLARASPGARAARLSRLEGRARRSRCRPAAWWSSIRTRRTGTSAIGLCEVVMTGLPIRFVGKDTLFAVPLRAAAPALGRDSRQPARAHRLHRAMVALFRRNANSGWPSRPRARAAAPPHWKIGVLSPRARGASVPLALGFIDYPRREIGSGRLPRPDRRPVGRHGAHSRVLRGQARPPSANQGPVAMTDGDALSARVRASATPSARRVNRMTDATVMHAPHAARDAHAQAPPRRGASDATRAVGGARC